MDHIKRNCRQRTRYRVLRVCCSYDGARAKLFMVSSTYVIERPFTFTLIIDMKRTSKKENVFESKDPSQGLMHGPGGATSISTSTGITDLIPTVPACDPDETATQVQTTDDVSVSVQLRPSHL